MVLVNKIEQLSGGENSYYDKLSQQYSYSDIDRTRMDIQEKALETLIDQVESKYPNVALYEVSVE